MGGFVCALCVVTVGYFGFHRHFASLRTETTERVGLVQAKLENGESIRRNYAAQKKTLAELLQRVEQVRQRVPEQAEEGEFLANVSRLARTHKIQINDFKRGASTAKDDHSSTQVTITGAGAHADLCRFLEAIEQLPRVAHLTQMSVNSKADRDGYPIVLSYALYFGKQAESDTTRVTR